MPEADYLLDSYDYYLPEHLIAQYPCANRVDARLLVLERRGSGLVDDYFKNIGSHLPQGALLVANNSRVLPARLTGRRPFGGRVEFLLLTPLPLVLENRSVSENWSAAAAECLLKPGAKIRAGMVLDFGADLKVEVLKKGEFGLHEAMLHWRGNLETIFEDHGVPPLPPYIKRTPQKEDMGRYQTIYAKNTGSVAAPTAGLHFSPALCADLRKSGFEWLETTLHVGYGTFSPVRSGDIREHNMHREYVIVDEHAANAIRKAKNENRAVVAVGTTSLRALESAAMNGRIEPFSGWTNLFIYPGKKFNVVDGLITNFHLPKSSLLMLAAAFAGREKILAAYEQAVRLNYRFFSYGDAMLIR